MQLANPRVVVHKSLGVLELFDGTAPVKKYVCITGGNGGDKEREGDRKTPLGSFHIVYKNPQSKYHLSLGLDYPNREDAQRGLAAGLITREQYDGIVEALASDLSKESNQKKLWYTPLGGEIFIHGYANGRTGTAGCVALQNPDVEELYAVLPVGTPVEIRP
jgi:murein L,D-transpeptidase YafK